MELAYAQAKFYLTLSSSNCSQNRRDLRRPSKIVAIDCEAFRQKLAVAETKLTTTERLVALFTNYSTKLKSPNFAQGRDWRPERLLRTSRRAARSPVSSALRSLAHRSADETCRNWFYNLKARRRSKLLALAHLDGLIGVCVTTPARCNFKRAENGVNFQGYATYKRTIATCNGACLSTAKHCGPLLTLREL